MESVAVVAAGWVRNRRSPVGVFVGREESSDTLLGFEKQHACLVVWLSPRSWWWGVVFDCWIVVASI